MTGISVNTMDSRHGRWVKVARGTAKGLWEIADRLQAIGVAGIVMVAGANMLGIGPGWISQADRNHAAVLMLAVWGLISWLQPAMEGTADAINPDARDGDALFTVADDIRDVAADVRNGADWDDVRVGLQCSGVLPAVYELLDNVGTAYAFDGEPDEAEAMQDAATAVRTASRHLGDKSA